jgi:hypothetical protein
MRNGMLTGKTCLAETLFVNLRDCGEDVILAAAGVVSLYGCSVFGSSQRPSITNQLAHY